MNRLLIIKISFYLTCFLLYSGSFIWTFLLYGYEFKNIFYLTNINLYSNFIYISMMMYFCVFNQLQLHKKIENYFYKFNFCFAFTVLCIYWALVLIDVNLVLKRKIPVALDLFLHGGVFSLILIEHYFISTKRFTRKIGVQFFSYFYAIYSFIAFSLYYFFDMTLYPLINQIDFIDFILLTFCTFCVSTISTFIYKVLIEFKRDSYDDMFFIFNL